ncbi:MAG: hypothetical protein AABX03_00025 [Nanoarchaeota archaeon]
MTSKEEHIRKIKKHLAGINDAIDQGIENKPISIGFHCSACSVELLELYLHTINKISIGHMIKHDWFKGPKIEQKIEPLIERKLKVSFDKKEIIYDLIYKIEEKRNNLVYGSPTKKTVEEVLNNFLKLKNILLDLLKEEGVKIE